MADQPPPPPPRKRKPPAVKPTGKPTPWPAGTYAGSIVLDTAGRGVVVNVRNEVIVLALEQNVTRRYSVAQARQLAVELWQAAEQLELAEGQPRRR